MAADEGALPTPAGLTGSKFARFTATTRSSSLTFTRHFAAMSGGVRSTTTCRPLAAAFDTSPRSSTVAPMPNGSAGGAAAGAATARGTRFVRLNRDCGVAGAGGARRFTRCVAVPRVRVVRGPKERRRAAARRSAGVSKMGAGSGSAHHGISFAGAEAGGDGVAAGTASTSMTTGAVGGGASESSSSSSSSEAPSNHRTAASRPRRPVAAEAQSDGGGGSDPCPGPRPASTVQPLKRRRGARRRR